LQLAKVDEMNKFVGIEYKHPNPNYNPEGNRFKSNYYPPFSSFLFKLWILNVV